MQAGGERANIFLGSRPHSLPTLRTVNSTEIQILKRLRVEMQHEPHLPREFHGGWEGKAGLGQGDGGSSGRDGGCSQLGSSDVT